jgi:predicted TIM-barrel fold metal-dependent hydrolase
MDQAGVDRAVLAPVATRAGQEEGILRWVQSLRSERLVPFAGLYPTGEDAVGHLHRIADAGIAGIKLHPDYQAYFVDDPAVDPVYAAAADLGLIILFHAGVDIGLPDPVHASPERLARVLDRHPGLRCILAHLGGYRMWDEVERHLVGRSCFFDTAYLAGRVDTTQFLRIVRNHGVERVLFATDYPWSEPVGDLAWLRSSGLDDRELDLVQGANAARLLCGSA